MENTGSTSYREVLASSHESRSMHKGASRACQHSATHHAYRSSLSLSLVQIKHYPQAHTHGRMHIHTPHASIHMFETSLVYSMELLVAVWRELLKENMDFFQAYFHAISPRPFISKPLNFSCD
ncbi:hypothetical protein L1049_006005 [Liquidambar formosana]|uniref:Uncharacterized protein n=1 Tax=Liquidambar formosana TaxID=63359 RepID=A0AAP0WQF1_LIQFO